MHTPKPWYRSQNARDLSVGAASKSRSRCWIAAGAVSAWLLGWLCNAIFGLPIVGDAMCLAFGIVGVMKTTD